MVRGVEYDDDLELEDDDLAPDEDERDDVDDEREDEERDGEYERDMLLLWDELLWGELPWPPPLAKAGDGVPPMRAAATARVAVACTSRCLGDNVIVSDGVLIEAMLGVETGLTSGTANALLYVTANVRTREVACVSIFGWFVGSPMVAFCGDGFPKAVPTASRIGWHLL